MFRLKGVSLKSNKYSPRNKTHFSSHVRQIDRCCGTRMLWRPELAKTEMPSFVGPAIWWLDDMFRFIKHIFGIRYIMYLFWSRRWRHLTSLAVIFQTFHQVLLALLTRHPHLSHLPTLASSSYSLECNYNYEIYELDRDEYTHGRLRGLGKAFQLVDVACLLPSWSQLQILLFKLCYSLLVTLSHHRIFQHSYEGSWNSNLKRVYETLSRLTPQSAALTMAPTHGE